MVFSPDSKYTIPSFPWPTFPTKTKDELVPVQIPPQLPPSPPSDTPALPTDQQARDPTLLQRDQQEVERKVNEQVDESVSGTNGVHLDDGLETEHQTPTPVSQEANSAAEEINGLSLVPSSGSEFMVAMSDVSNSLQDIMAAFTVFDECSERYARLPSLYPTLKEDIEALSQEIKREEDTEKLVFEEIRQLVATLSEQAVVAYVKDEMPIVIPEVVMRQVKEEVELQIGDYMPVSLQEQADESKKQLEEIKVSLQNSEARTNNSFIQISNLFDPLDTVLTPDGSKSPLYPPNVKSLLGYDVDSARSLNRDYGLTETEDLRVNLQHFLKHIGTSVDIVIPDFTGQ